MLAYARGTEIAQVVLQVRRERRALEKLFEAAAESGDVETASMLHACICRNREHIFRLCGFPQAPRAVQPKEKSAKVVDSMAVTAQIRDA